MSVQNWPGGIDRASSNWTGRTPRTADWGGAWQPNTHRIPRRAVAAAVAVVALAFIILPWLGHGAGF